MFTAPGPPRRSGPLRPPGRSGRQGAGETPALPLAGHVLGDLRLTRRDARPAARRTGLRGGAT